MNKINDLYTIKMHRIRDPKTKVVIRHCIKDEDENYFRPVAYKDGEDERVPVTSITNQTGWDYEPLDGMGYSIDSIEQESK